MQQDYEKYMKKLNLFLIIILTTVFISGCTHKSDKNSVTNKDQMSGQNVKLDNIKIEKEKKDNMMQITYKEIADFKPIEAKFAVLETNKGTIVLELYREDAPLTTLNFLNLIDSGFYDGIVFHRVIEDFMAQVGDPLTKDESKKYAWGTGGPDYRIKDEFSPKLKHDKKGILSMANAGPNSGGSQIFITYEPQPHLDGKHAVFGIVVEGMDVLDAIEQGDKIIKASYK